MFEGLRKHSQSFMLIILIATLATIFGVSFGPRQGCRSGALRVNNVAKVYGTSISEQDFQTLARLSRLSETGDPSAIRRTIVDRLIERELLAHEAERFGFRVTDEDLNRDIRDGFYYNALGMRRINPFNPLAASNSPPETTRGWTSYSSIENRAADAPPPPFSYDDFESWVRTYFGRTVREYKTLMTREMLAQRMRDAVMSSVQVSEDEVWRNFQRQRNEVSFRYLQFSPEFYRLTVRDDDQAAVDAFASSHAAEITRQWEQSRESLRGLPAQVRIRYIRLNFPEHAEEPARIATRQRAEAIRARIVNGGDFVRMARLYSQEDNSWRTASESSWVAVDHIDPPADVQRVIPNLQPGQISEPISTPNGVYVVQLLGRRQGDVSEADARREIARNLYVITRGEELAAEAATRAQQWLGETGATIDSVAARVREAALTAFYHGPVPTGPETLPGNNPLEMVSHTDVGAPELRETQPFHQEGGVPQIEHSEALARAAFALTDEHPTAAAPIAVDSDRYVIRLRDGGRHIATREEFDRERQAQMDGELASRRLEALQQFVSRLRAEAERRGELKIGNSPLIQERPANARRDEESTG